jgi:oligopeptide/dipeptide ABC transporter ATP-binding protein
LKGEGKVSTRQATKLSVELLRKVGIPDPQSRMDAYPFQLSGGMRQRVMIAIALLRKPALLLADEPTTALDVSIQMQILDLLLDLKDGLGMSIVFVTHDMGVVAKMCDRVMVLYSGRAMETGTVKELFARPRHPYTRALLGCIPSLTHRRKDKLPTLKGAPNPTRHERGCPFFERCDRGLEKCQRVDPEEIRFSDSQAASCWNPVPH